uniref:type I protein arginine methyltransferase n=1 Tax=Lepeophtheirus salmonis TaxID=72036 RepID=A0A0K2UAB2_LEPSM
MTDEDSCNRNYFGSYEDIEIHKLMLEDKPRTEAYRDAILNNASLFKDKVVMDVGAGSGILSLFAAKAGAKRVYAVEASSISDPLKKIVELNGYGGVIQIVAGRAEDVEIPEKVDIMISEWMGFYLFHESMLNSFIKARDKHLDTENDGFVFPSSAILYVAPSSLPLLREAKDYWNDVYGFNMSPMVENVRMKPEIVYIEDSNLLSEPKAVTKLNLNWVSEENVNEISLRELFTLSQDGSFNSVVLWFDVTFDAASTDESITIHSSTLSTGPSSPSTHWKQTIIPLEVNKELKIGDKILFDLFLDQSKENPRQYVIELELLDESNDELHPVPCHCHSYRCDSALTLLNALNGEDDDDSI